MKSAFFVGDLFLPGFAVALCCCILSGCGLLIRGEKNEEGQNPGIMLQGDPVPYVTTIIVHPPAINGDVISDIVNDNATDITNDKSNELKAGTRIADSIRSLMEAGSLLVQLADQPPDSRLGLERRARDDEATAQKLLHSLGYYDGKVDTLIDGESFPALVALTLIPGPLYTIDEMLVAYDPEPVIPPEFIGRTRLTGLLLRSREAILDPHFPEELPGLNLGDPADADSILRAAATMPMALRTQGYPFAAIRTSRYTINTEQKTLQAAYLLHLGPPALMGAVEVKGTELVEQAFLQRLAPWTVGVAWNAELIREYREVLQQTSLFSLINITPGGMLPNPETGHTDYMQIDGSGQVGYLPIKVEVREAPPRTVAFAAKYSTEKGVGVQGSWEHRNLLHNGELLQLKLPITKDIQEFTADFSKPAFFHRNQQFLAGFGIGRERSEAYTKDAFSIYSGLERRFAPIWRADLRLYLEYGHLEDHIQKTDYKFTNLRLGVTRDTRDNMIDPTEGSLLVMTLSPYLGYYDDPFQVLSASADASIFFSPFEGKRLVLAGRMAAGSMIGATAFSLPASLRFYAGGGGSVRGYSYQSIGPRDAGNSPLGGLSFMLTNLEARLKVTESIGLAPFFDGGMVYDRAYPSFGNISWAAGLGLRYYTAIGPVRLDVAFPLQRRTGEDVMQFYISLGQAF